MKITFLGAAKTVTGSCFLVEINDKKILVDCGMYQGSIKDMITNFEPFSFDINKLDAMILTHAHIDHSGRIPKLYLDGYRGPIYCTRATYDLCTIMLPDSGHIQEVEIEWVNRKRKRAGKSPSQVLYTVKDAQACLELFKPLRYDNTIQILDGIKIQLIDAGHMLGSSIVEIYYEENGKEEKLVFSGDLGVTNRPLLKDPNYISSADYLVIESTYGDRLHSKIEDESERFLNIILDTIEKGGNVVIPSFAVGRTQEILYEINKNKDRYGEEKVCRLCNVPVYVDSPLAVSATEVFERNIDCFDEETKQFLMNGDNPLDFKNLHFIVTAEESKAINFDTTPKIIISASGMCEVGRIKHHLKHNLWRKDSTILFVGFQAEGTLGKKIVSGQTPVKIFGEEIDVNARIEYLDGFSGHADKNGLLDWISNIDEKPKDIFIVHGESIGQISFAKTITDTFNIPTIIPSKGDQYEIIDRDIQKIGFIEQPEQYSNLRLGLIEKLAKLREDVDILVNGVKGHIKQTSNDSDLQDIFTKIENLEQKVNEYKLNSNTKEEDKNNM